MSESDPRTKVVLDRLRTLFLKLDDEGLYISANTASLAIEEIERLSETLDAPLEATAPSGQAPLEGEVSDKMLEAAFDEWTRARLKQLSVKSALRAAIRSALLPASAEPVATKSCGCVFRDLDVACRNPECKICHDLPASGEVEAGWQLVPVEPTPEMLVAAEEAVDELAGFYAKHDSPSYKAWQAFLSAAPTEGR